jgi:hypothetical protein
MVREYDSSIEKYYSLNDTVPLTELIVKLDHNYIGIDSLTDKELNKIRRKTKKKSCTVIYISTTLYEEGVGGKDEILAICDSVLITRDKNGHLSGRIHKIR